jgi:hypothetical protein
VITPRAKIWLFFLLAVAVFVPTAHADDCDDGGDLDTQISDLRTQRANAADADKIDYTNRISNIQREADSKRASCRNEASSEQAKQKKIAKSQADCQKKIALYPTAFSWDDSKNKCVDKSEQASSKSLPDSGDCSSASAFAGDLKGQNCKKALDVVSSVNARNSAITGASTAAATVYTGAQASGATGLQDDAQTRSANMMKMVAFSKFATGITNMMGAAQLKNAANQAADANSTITGAYKNIQGACQSADDDQACFYQNAPKYGIAHDQQAYASYDRLKRGAQQSQDQADAANSLAKTSMITGASDMLTGFQAMQMAQQAHTNAAAFAPPPMILPPPPTVTRFGDGMAGPTAPSLAPAAPTGVTDYGTPTNDAGTFGNARHGEMAGGLIKGAPMGAVNIFKAATSGVSGGGGGGGVGGGGLRSGGGGAGARPRNSKSGTGVGEVNLAGGGAKGPGGSVGDKPDASNPLNDMLAKLFPQDKDGKTVVDQRQIASNNGGVMENSDQADTVAAADLSIFEQISTKYRQLNGDGRF